MTPTHEYQRFAGNGMACARAAKRPAPGRWQGRRMAGSRGLKLRRLSEGESGTHHNAIAGGIRCPADSANSSSTAAPTPVDTHDELPDGRKLLKTTHGAQPREGRPRSQVSSLADKNAAEPYFLIRPPAFDGASAAEVDRRSEPDRRTPERRSPTTRRSSSDRLSRPLRRSLPERRSAFARLLSMLMLRLRWSRGSGKINQTTCFRPNLRPNDVSGGA